MTTTFAVPQIVCEGCASSITKAVRGLPGIDRVEVDIPGKKVTVEFDDARTNADAVRERIEAAGFDVA